MSQKVKDSKNRWRNKTIAFRVSPEEYDQITAFASISGQTKQDYLINRALQRDIIVNGSPRTYKLLKDEMAKVLEKLENADAPDEFFDETLLMIQQINTTLYGFKNNN